MEKQNSKLHRNLGWLKATEVAGLGIEASTLGALDKQPDGRPKHCTGFALREQPQALNQGAGYAHFLKGKASAKINCQEKANFNNQLAHSCTTQCWQRKMTGVDARLWTWR